MHISHLLTGALTNQQSLYHTERLLTIAPGDDCLLRFQPTDFVEVRQESAASEKEIREVPLRRLLKDGVVWSVFPERRHICQTGAKRRELEPCRRRRADVKHNNSIYTALKIRFVWLTILLTRHFVTSGISCQLKRRFRQDSPSPLTTNHLLHIFVLRVTDLVPSVSACITIH